MSDGMFLSACREVSKEFPDVKYDEDLLDRVCLQVRSISFSATAWLTYLILDRHQSKALLRPGHGDAQFIRRHPFRHVCRSHRRTWAHPFRQHWTSMSFSSSSPLVVTDL